MFSRSVAQIATASMRTSTSAFFGTGTGLSVSASSPGSPSTHAFMVSEMGQSGLVFTPGGAYMLLVPSRRRLGTAPAPAGANSTHQRIVFSRAKYQHRRSTVASGNNAAAWRPIRFPGDQFGLMLRSPLSLSFETALRPPQDEA